MGRQDIRFEWEDQERAFSVDDSPVMVGRLKRCDVTVVSPLVSRKHLLVLWDGDKWRVTDMSANGVFSESKLPTSWDVEDEPQVRLGAIDGPRLSIIPIKSDADDEQRIIANGNGARSENSDNEAEKTSMVTVTPAADSDQLKDGGASPNPEDLSGSSSVESDASAVPAGLVTTRPIDEIQVQSDVLDSFVEQDDDSLTTASNGNADVSGRPASVGLQGSTEVLNPPGEDMVAKSATVKDRPGVSSISSSEVSTESKSQQANGDSDRPEKGSVKSSLFQTGNVAREIGIDEPRVTGKFARLKDQLNPEPSVTGQVQISRQRSMANKLQAAAVVIASALLAYVAWMFISRFF